MKLSPAKAVQPIPRFSQVIKLLEKTGGNAGVLREYVSGLFLYAHIPRVREAWVSQFHGKGGGSGELHECRMLFGDGPFPETYRGCARPSALRLRLTRSPVVLSIWRR